MKNLSTLSSALYGAAAGAVVSLVPPVLQVVSGQFGWTIGVSVLPALICTGVVVALLTARRNLIRITETCARVADGDMEARISPLTDGGEMRLLQRKINHMTDVTDAFVREANASLDHVSQGKYFRLIIERGLPGEFRRSAGSINKAVDAMAEKDKFFKQLSVEFDRDVKGVVDTVASASTELQSSAQAMSGTMDTTKERVTGMRGDAATTFENVQAVASAAEELASSVGEINQQVVKATEIARKACEQADATNADVEGLSKTANSISDVVNMINDIAEQTNLLALNATIEAARAGEAGKGFAIVANEVKALASQTANATAEIGNQISSIQGATDGAVSSIQGISGTISEMTEYIGAIAAAVEEQSAATREIARNVQVAADSTRGVSGSIDKVDEASGDAERASSEVNQAASQLSQQAEVLSGSIDSFFEGIRAA